MSVERGGSASVLYFLFLKGFDVVVCEGCSRSYDGSLTRAFFSNPRLKNKKKRGSKQMPC